MITDGMPMPVLVKPWNQNECHQLSFLVPYCLSYNAWVFFTATTESTALQRCAIRAYGLIVARSEGGYKSTWFQGSQTDQVWPLATNQIQRQGETRQFISVSPTLG